MTKFNWSKREYCPRCNAMRGILHRHQDRLIKIEEPPAGSPYTRQPRLAPGWSKLDEDEIEQALSDEDEPGETK